MTANQPKPPSPGFAADIKPLFTQLDRDHMLKKFDLFMYDDVKTFATEIYQTLKNQTMPPKGSEPQAPWPDEDVARFKAWMDGGFTP